jgi:uncharacterized protein (DUF433 family)
MIRMDAARRVVSDPRVLAGKPHIEGTRISVELILDELANGHHAAEIVSWFPQLTEADIRAALAFAAQALHSEAVYPVAGAS